MLGRLAYRLVSLLQRSKVVGRSRIGRSVTSVIVTIVNLR